MKISIKTIIALFLIFICGIVIGSGGTLIVERAMIRRAIENPVRARMLFIHRIEREYKLTPKQKIAIRGIIEDETRQLAQVRLNAAPEMEKILIDARSRISSELGESQRAKFEPKFDKWMTRFRKIYYVETLDKASP